MQRFNLSAWVAPCSVAIIFVVGLSGIYFTALDLINGVYLTALATFVTALGATIGAASFLIGRWRLQGAIVTVLSCGLSIGALFFEHPFTDREIKAIRAERIGYLTQIAMGSSIGGEYPTFETQSRAHSIIQKNTCNPLMLRGAVNLLCLILQAIYLEPVYALVARWFQDDQSQSTIDSCVEAFNDLIEGQPALLPDGLLK